jgi:hypothetical protein
VPSDHHRDLHPELEDIELIGTTIDAIDHFINRHTPSKRVDPAQAVNPSIVICSVGNDAVYSVTRHVTFLVAKADGATHSLSAKDVVPTAFAATEAPLQASVAIASDAACIERNTYTAAIRFGRKPIETKNVENGRLTLAKCQLFRLSNVSSGSQIAQ